MIRDDEPAATVHAFDIPDGINPGKQTMALEGFEVRRVLGDLIEAGIATKGRFLFGQEMDFREIRQDHSINPFRGDYSTDTPRGARDGQGGIRMWENVEAERVRKQMSKKALSRELNITSRTYWN